ncbi:hypothetical protein B0H10DRAFT_1729467, partial [Mycena sp. CBHHK59/15]
SRLRSVIASAPHDLSCYDEDISAIQQVLDRLVAARSTLQVYADKCQSVFSPIRRLPSEVLLEIFNMPTAQERLRRLAKPHLLNLSQVCSTWHTLAIGTPALWAMI